MLRMQVREDFQEGLEGLLYGPKRYHHKARRVLRGHVSSTPNVSMCKSTCQDRETIVKKAFGVYRRGERAHGIRKNNNAEGRATTCWEPPQPHGRQDPQGTGSPGQRVTQNSTVAVSAFIVL